MLVVEDGTELFDQGHESEVFFFDLTSLEAGELVETQLEDGVGLYLGERILGHEGDLGLVTILRRADDFDKVIQVIEGDLVTFEDVGAGFGLAQAEGRAAVDDLAAVIDIASEHLFDVHLLGATVVEREEDHAERAFEWCALVELVNDHARDCAAFEFDDDARGLGRFIAKIGDAVDSFLLDQFGDANDEGGAVHIIRDSGDDDLLLAFVLDDFGDATCADDPATGFEVAIDA